MAVQYSVELLMNQERVFENQTFLDYISDHKQRGWSEELQRWPCLANDLAINLNFENNAVLTTEYDPGLDTLH